jgi:hypothetical protein
MHLSLLRWAPSFHSLCSTRLLRPYYMPTTLHECSSPCNYCFLALYLSCIFIPFSYALNDPYQLPSAWLHLVPKWLPIWFPCAMGTMVGEGSGNLLLHRPIPMSGSARETPHHQLPAPRLRTSRPCTSPEATDEVPEVTPVHSRSSRDLPDGRRQRTDSGVAHRDIHPRRKRQAVIHDFDYATLKEDGKVSNESDEEPCSKKSSSSNHRGHDYRQPKRQSSAKYFGASDWTTKEWKILRSSSNISDPDAASDDDSKPCLCTKASRRKAKWSTGLGQRKV